MLKTLIFFLFGCSLYFGQSTTVTGSQSFNQNNGVVNRNTIEGDGTRASNSGGGSGSGNNLPNVLVVQDGNNLRVSLTRSEARFNSYSLYNNAGMAILEDQRIISTNSYSLDISNLTSGNYYISVEITTPVNLLVTKPFIKP